MLYKPVKSKNAAFLQVLYDIKIPHCVHFLLSTHIIVHYYCTLAVHEAL